MVSLGKCYHAELNGTLPAAMEHLKAELQDETVRREAQAELQRLEGINRAGQRCHISKKFAEYLKEALTLPHSQAHPWK